MKESSSIAHTYADTFLGSLDPENGSLRDGGMHMHIPEGATPKVRSMLVCCRCSCLHVVGWAVGRDFDDDVAAVLRHEQACAE